jgi:hypothetical protein
MAKLLFWVTSGADQEEKVVANLRLALRLKTVRQQEVRVFFYGPGLRLAESGDETVRAAIAELHHQAVRMQACPNNAKLLNVNELKISGQGIAFQSAGEVLSQLVEEGYQVITV